MGTKNSLGRRCKKNSPLDDAKLELVKKYKNLI
jgi:hypothetical protein